MDHLKSQFSKSSAVLAVMFCTALLSACIPLGIPVEPVKPKSGMKDLGCLPEDQLKAMRKQMDQSHTASEYATSFGIGHLGNLVGAGEVAELGYESKLSVDKLRKQKAALRFIDYHACAPGEEPATLPTPEDKGFVDSINVFSR